MYHRIVIAWMLMGMTCLAEDSLESGFRQPPIDARPWVYWFFMDGNVSREGMTADLEAMRRAGLGGMIMMEVDVGIPRGPVRFMSPEWQQCFRHAVKEAERLGLQIALNVGPGWTGSGGPWVKPEQSMQHLVVAETNVAGPARFDALLPRAQPRKPFFGEGALPEAQERVRKEYYRDVVVLAFPTPEGQSRIPDFEEKAFYFRAPYSSQAGVKPWLPAPAEHPRLPAPQCVDSHRLVDLTSKLSADGRLEWEAPAGNWTIERFGRTSTGQNTRPAPQPGLGLECDKFDKGAVDAHFEAFIGALSKTVGPRASRRAGWTMLHLDSWEMSSQNWSARFREDFKQRRGYDLWSYLPALAGRVVGSVELTERFLWDLRQTAQELIVANYAGRLKELGRQHGFGLSLEPYDMNPCADLNLGGVADVPMCEFWAKGYGFDTEFSCFEAVSIAHTLGRPVVAAESFTSGDQERWLLYPGALKAQGDWAFCTGINRLVIHRYQHQPWRDRWPGMTMGPYGVHWERTQTWWDLVPAYHQYLARCQFLLRRGLPVADICYLVPEGAPQVFRPPASATRGNPRDRLGYNFDACAPEVLMDRMSVNHGRLALPDGMSYRVLVLPNFETMTPALLRKVRQLVLAGATVVGAPPRQSPSLSNYPECDAEVKRLALELWGESETPVPGAGGAVASAPRINERQVGKGRVIRPDSGALPQQAPLDPFAQIYPDYAPTAELLAKMGVAPDFDANPTLRHTHRRDGESDIYFIANPANQALAAQATFRVSGRQPEWWDAISGKRRALAQFTEQSGRTVVPLWLEAHQSGFVVFRRESRQVLRTGGNFAEFAKVGEIVGPWIVRFQAQRGGPESAVFDHLIDWSGHPAPGIRHFSGLATYRTDFEWKPAGAGETSRSRILLDLGQVQVMAAVKLNGHDLGVVWTNPFRVEAGGALRRGANRLEVAVANLWPNRLIGDAGLPPEKRVTWTTWNPFKPNTALVKSGLLGPVTLLQEN